MTPGRRHPPRAIYEDTSPGDLGAAPKATQPQTGRTTLCARPVCLQSPESSSCLCVFVLLGLSAGAVLCMIEKDSAGDPGAATLLRLLLTTGRWGASLHSVCRGHALRGAGDARRKGALHAPRGAGGQALQESAWAGRVLTARASEGVVVAVFRLVLRSRLDFIAIKKKEYF